MHTTVWAMCALLKQQEPCTQRQLYGQPSLHAFRVAAFAVGPAANIAVSHRRVERGQTGCCETPAGHDRRELRFVRARCESIVGTSERKTTTQRQRRRRPRSRGRSSPGIFWHVTSGSNATTLGVLQLEEVLCLESFMPDG